ncbi:MAG: hypothetical protein K0U66_02535, partial [Gammaproteobacteria bacterium]|nr:hypothetical protein [Gammaproteobacteria bacterium]
SSEISEKCPFPHHPPASLATLGPQTINANRGLHHGAPNYQNLHVAIEETHWLTYNSEISEKCPFPHHPPASPATLGPQTINANRGFQHGAPNYRRRHVAAEQMHWLSYTAEISEQWPSSSHPLDSCAFLGPHSMADGGLACVLAVPG